MCRFWSILLENTYRRGNIGRRMEEKRRRAESVTRLTDVIHHVGPCPTHIRWELSGIITAITAICYCFNNNRSSSVYSPLVGNPLHKMCSIHQIMLDMSSQTLRESEENSSFIDNHFSSRSLCSRVVLKCCLYNSTGFTCSTIRFRDDACDTSHCLINTHIT